MKLNITLPYDIPYDYIFGGAVRDTIRGVQPVDYDFIFLSEAKMKAALDKLAGFKCQEMTLHGNFRLIFLRGVRAYQRGIGYDLFCCASGNTTDVDALRQYAVDITANNGFVDEDGNLIMEEAHFQDAKNSLIVPMPYIKQLFLWRCLCLKRRGMKMTTASFSSMILYLNTLVGTVCEPDPVVLKDVSPKGRYIHVGMYSDKSPRKRVISRDLLELFSWEFLTVLLLQSDGELLEIVKQVWNTLNGNTRKGRILRKFRLWNWYCRRKGWQKPSD